MKTEKKDLETCQTQLTVTLDADETKAVVKEVEKEFLRTASMPGFRKGKLPIELIRKNFASQLKQETDRAIFQKHYRDAVKAAGIDEVALASVDELAFDEEGAKFVVTIDVLPTFKVPTYVGLKIAPAETKVEDKAVQEQVDRLRVAYATFEDGKPGETASEGDFIQIDYEGMIGKKKILEVNPEAKVVAEGKGFWTQLEEGRFLPEILDAVKGMAVGETKTGVKAKFDKESAPEGLKGEKATYSVTLTNLRRRILPTDEQFVEKAKAESLEKLTAQVREAMEAQLARQEAARRENDAIDLLLKKADFAVPPSEVRRATERFLSEFANRAQNSGVDASYFKDNSEKILSDATEAATRQVRLWHIIRAIAEAENFDVKDDAVGQKVLEFVLGNAKK